MGHRSSKLFNYELRITNYELRSGGGAIDLIMHLNICNFKEAIVWLNDRFGSESNKSRTILMESYE